MEKLASNKRQLKSSSGGYIIIEAIVGVVLASVLLTAFLALTVQATKLNRININNFKADMYLKELIEVAKDLEQSDWVKISFSGIYYPCDPSDPSDPEFCVDSKWSLYSGSESLNSGMFTRSLTIEDVCRDNYLIDHFEFPNNIVACDGIFILDPNTKKIIAHIEWNDNSHPPMTLEMYVYNYVP